MGAVAKREYYLVFLCDNWKTAASFSLCGMTSSLVFLKRKLITMLRNNVIEGEAEQIWKAEAIHELNDCVVYAYIQAVRNGEFNTDGCGL